MDSNAIASLAMSMSQANLQQNIGISVMKKAMDNSEQNAASIIQMMAPTQTFSGEVGNIFDARA